MPVSFTFGLGLWLVTRQHVARHIGQHPHESAASYHERTRDSVLSGNRKSDQTKRGDKDRDPANDLAQQSDELGHLIPCLLMKLAHLYSNSSDPLGATLPVASERDLNGAAAAMAGIAPQNETEAMLAAQMVAVHAAAMGALRRLKGAETIQQQDSTGNLATKLLRTYAAQVEALQRLRGKGQQTVRVEHVTVQAGGQAIVGTVTGGTGGKEKSEGQPDAKQLTHAPGETRPSEVQADKTTLPVTSG